MNRSNAAWAAIVFAGGTAVGIATGLQMAPDASESEQRAVVENATLMENQQLLSQFEELSSRQEKAAQREAALDAKSEQLEKKLASLTAREEDVAQLHEELRAESEALEDQKTVLGEQEKIVSAQLQSVLERESQLVASQQELETQRAAIRAQDLAQDTVAKLDIDSDQPVPASVSDPASSELNLSTIAPEEPMIVDKELEESSQTEQVAETRVPESDPAMPGNGPIAEVHFELNSAKLTPGAIKRAREAVGRLQNMEFSKIRIAGHTDTTGPASRNRALSNERAEAVAEIFVQAGVSRRMIEIVGFGETYNMLPVSTGDGISEPLNRCVGIFVEEIVQSSLQ